MSGEVLSRSLFKSKIHRATVTHADVEYEGSVTIDVDLLEAADILPYEEVHIWNVTRGTRLATYAMIGQRGSGTICVNGAAAHLVKPGDIIIISTFAQVAEADAREFKPRVVLVDGNNRIKDSAAVEIAGPAKRGSNAG